MSQEGGQNYTPIPLTTGSIFHAETQSAKLKALERENRELRQANEILRKASAYFALAELARS